MALSKEARALYKSKRGQALLKNLMEGKEMTPQDQQTIRELHELNNRRQKEPAKEK